jgi:hypothetical protein
MAKAVYTSSNIGHYGLGFTTIVILRRLFAGILISWYTAFCKMC